MIFNRGKYVLQWIRGHVAIIGLVIAFLTLVVTTSDFWVRYKDSDGDGYGDPDQYIWWVWQPKGYVDNNEDCYDGNKDARPGQTNFFTKDRGDGSFDYDCNGESEREFSNTGSCVSGIPNFTAQEGWDGRIPDVGKKGRWLVDCDQVLRWNPLPTIEITKDTVEKIQRGR